MRVTAGRVALGAASAGGMALPVCSLAVGSVPALATAGALGIFTTVLVAGAVIPRLEMYGDVLCRGRAGKLQVALTFDDGPNPDTTPRVLRALKAANARATFFVIGEKVERTPEVVRAVVEAGHELGVHGYHHDRLYGLKAPGDVQRDVERAQAAVEHYTGLRPEWFRPPIGHVSPRVVKGARRAGVRLVGWSARAFDGVRWATGASVVRRMERGLHDGAIVLLHDAAERDDRVPASVPVLPEILSVIARAGLKAVPLGELATG